jgi:hypothetical protein
MGENKQKGENYNGQSKYALKHQAQLKGHFLATSPFHNPNKDKKQEVKQDNSQQ